MNEERGARVLVVDDGPQNVALLRAQLERAGYVVDAAGDGASALEAVKAAPPDIVLLDLMMPGIDGYEVCRRLKNDELTRAIPVVMVTALTERAAKLRSLEGGADEFLSKPVDRAELLVRVRSLVRQKRLYEAALRHAEELAMARAEAKDEMVSIVSHELRTPLASLVGFAELLLMREFPEHERREFLTIMLEEGRRLTALINDFLDLQRMESGRQTVVPAPTELTPLLARAAAAMGEDPERPIVVEAPDDLPTVLADPDRMLQVLANLLSNARKYSPSGGDIRLSARRILHAVEVSVEDHGLGIPADAVPKLFNKFYRVDNSDRREIGGTGLGLAICQQIVTAHGGRIRAHSEGVGRGSRFTLTLPLADEDTAHGDVLIVEDDPGFARLVETLLIPYGLAATRVGDATVGLSQAAARRPRVVVLDLLLPGLQGEAMLPKLRELLGPGVPVVVVTVKEPTLEERRTFEALGVVGVLKKGPGAAAMAAQVVARAAGVLDPVQRSEVA